MIDIRPLTAYAAAHVVGTLNIPLTKAFTKWAGWLLPYDRDLYLIAPDPNAAIEAGRALRSIGLDRLRGQFGPETVSAAQASGMTGAIRQAPIGDSPMLQDAGTMIIDVRETDEWDAGHIDGAVNRPLGNLPQSLAVLDRRTPVALHCEGGTRSAIGAALLEQMGFSNVTVLTGGWKAWVEGREIERRPEQENEET